MRWEQKVQYASLSDIGFRRRNNQDAHVVMLSPDAETFQTRGHLFVVADGMGGHAVGELASKMAVDTIPHSYFKNRADDMPSALAAAIHEANAAIHERGSQNIDFNRMGTTCVALALGPNGGVAGHVGDSRLYRIRRDHIDQLTFDHSLEWELVRHGRRRPDDYLFPEAKHVITRSIGPEPTVEPEVEGPFPVWPGDIFLLCSDGLTGLVKDSEIGAIAKHLPPREACRLLVNLANLRGGPDNITAIITQVGPLPAGVSPQPDETPTPEPERDHFHWLWLGGLWMCALTFSLGVAWALLNQDVPRGATLSGVSLAAALAMGVLWRIQRRRRASESPVKIEHTPLSKAYQTANAKLTSEFMTMLVKLETEMKGTAQKESWSYDVAACEVANRAAGAALDKQHWPTALKELAVAIDFLMDGLQKHRLAAAREAAAKKDADNPVEPGERVRE